MSLSDFYVDLGVPEFGSFVGAPLARLLGGAVGAFLGSAKPLNSGEQEWLDRQWPGYGVGSAAPMVPEFEPFNQWLQRSLMSHPGMLAPHVAGIEPVRAARGSAVLSMPRSSDVLPAVPQVRAVRSNVGTALGAVGAEAGGVNQLALDRLRTQQQFSTDVPAAAMVRPPLVRPIDGFRITMGVRVNRQGITIALNSGQVDQRRQRPRPREGKDRNLRMRGWTRLAYEVLQGAGDAVGTLSEVQDLFEAFAWAAKDGQGRSAMAMERREAFRSGEGHGVYKGWATNWRQLAGVAEGIASGRYQVDLGEGIRNYAASSALDAAAGLGGRARQELANSLGYGLPVGQDALLGVHRRSGALWE